MKILNQCSICSVGDVGLRSVVLTQTLEIVINCVDQLVVDLQCDLIIRL